MKAYLSEDEMRQALFGSSNPSDPDPVPRNTAEPSTGSVQRNRPTPRPAEKPLSPKLRVTLHATKEFEGAVEIFTYDANTLSTFAAEQVAKSAAKLKKFKYFNVVSIKPI